MDRNRRLRIRRPLYPPRGGHKKSRTDRILAYRIVGYLVLLLSRKALGCQTSSCGIYLDHGECSCTFRPLTSCFGLQILKGGCFGHSASSCVYRSARRRSSLTPMPPLVCVCAKQHQQRDNGAGRCRTLWWGSRPRHCPSLTACGFSIAAMTAQDLGSSRSRVRTNSLYQKANPISRVSDLPENMSL